MLRMIGFLIKAAIVSLVILVLGNWVHWDGKSISDQVRIGMAHAERSGWMGTVKSTAHTMSRKITLEGHDRQDTQDASSTPNKKDPGMRRNLREDQRISGDSGDETPSEEIPSSERQKLRALIQELNGSRGED